jgi:hypothetical protein
MQTPIILAAALPLDVGTIILIVLAAALLPAVYRLCGVLAEINKTLAKFANPPPQASEPSLPKQSSPAPQACAAGISDDDSIAPEIIAIIAAAVAAATGKSHRVISIKPMSTSWERAGRQSVLTSHRIR